MAVLTDEQSMLRDSAQAWVNARAPVTAYRALRDSGSDLGHDPAMWREMAEMGWTGIIVPEEYGGFGFGYIGMGVILEQLGRTLTASPLLSSALAATSALVLEGTRIQKERWLPSMAAGDRIATLAVDEGPRHATHDIALAARTEGDGWRLSGDKRNLLDGMAADVFIVAARSAGLPGDMNGITLFLVEADADGVRRVPVPQIDRRGTAALRLENVRVEPEAVLGEVDGGGPLLTAVLDRARAGLSAEMLGAATHAFELTIDYIKTRIQFGKPLGSFQALQHRAAELLGEIELARSSVEAALAAMDEGASQERIAELASLAKLMMTETLRRTANEMVQMHGGIGMTDEHDAGFYLKRSCAAAVAYGDAAFHRERFGVLAGF